MIISIAAIFFSFKKNSYFYFAMWKRALLYWWPLPVFNTANVLFREYFLEWPVGNFTANQLTVTAMVIFSLIYTWLVIVKMRPTGLLNALQYGAWWVLFTLVAQFGLNIALKGWSLNHFFHIFNFKNPPFWLVIYLCMLLTPLLMYIVRRKAIRI